MTTNLISGETWVYCNNCGKRLAVKTNYGTVRFKYANHVDMEIHGTIKLRCLDRKCEKWQLINILKI